MRVQDVMTSGVRTTSPSAPAEDAWNLMRLHRIHHLVATAEGRVLGVLSDRDAGGPRGAVVRANRTVGELMTCGVVTVKPTATVRQAANLMRGRSIGCLVVVDAGRIAGIVTASDLLALIGQGIEHGAKTSRRYTLKHRTPHRKSRGRVSVW